MAEMSQTPRAGDLLRDLAHKLEGNDALKDRAQEMRDAGAKLDLVDERLTALTLWSGSPQARLYFLEQAMNESGVPAESAQRKAFEDLKARMGINPEPPPCNIDEFVATVRARSPRFRE